ncbi:unnamed protein product [Adineta ricciae]|uniref:Kinesin light chain n=3 Tax=Adineta ricciae TaxID=249248 RepID=A0A815T4I0_ADIRI|nr:unnamed protein product [Adineta ricciae]
MLSKVKTLWRLKLRKHSQNTQKRLNNKLFDESINDNQQQRRDDNEEDITLIWLNKTEKSPSTVTSLRNVIDYLQIFNNENAALSYIESIVDEKIILITDDVSDHILARLESFKQIHSIFLYTPNLPVDLPSKVTACCLTEEQLIDEMVRSCKQLSDQLVVFSIYNHQKKEKCDLTREAGSFLFFQLFKAAFTILPKTSESKRLLMKKCRQYYAGNTKVLEEIRNFEINYKPHEALEWFTKKSFIYRLVNKALRTENINSLCLLHFYIADLSKQLENEFSKFRKQNSDSLIKCYRTFQFSSYDIQYFQYNIGNLILTNGYLSATRNRQLAAGDKVLFEYTIDLNEVKSIVFANITENEILFDIGTVFKMNSCTYIEKDEIWIVNVSATDEGANFASEYIEYQRLKMTNSNLILMLGHLMIETGDYNKAEKYFQAILHSSIPNDEEISCIYFHLGRIYRLQSDYTHAVEYLNHAYETHSRAKPLRLASAAKALNAIGILHQEQNNYQEAIEAFENVLKIYGKTIQESHPDVAGTLINLGNTYCQQERFSDALSCFNRAQTIYDCNLPTNHPNVAMLWNNLGNFYYQQLQLDSALDAYQRALAIYEKLLPPNHPDILRNQNNLLKVKSMFGDQYQSTLEWKYGVKNTLFVED